MSSLLVRRFLERCTTLFSETKKCRYEKSRLNLQRNVPGIAKSKYSFLRATPKPPIPLDPSKYTPKLENFQRETLPNDKSEIRGVDLLIHQLMITKFKPKFYKPLLQNEFLLVQFFPRNHLVSNYRKSNISFVFVTWGIPTMNDAILENARKNYNGRYKKLAFFTSKPSPTQSACGRTILKKVLRSLFVEALDTVRSASNINRIAGVYACYIKKVPVNEEQKQLVKKGFAGLISKIATDTNLWKELEKTSSKSKELNVSKLTNKIKSHYEAGGIIDPRPRFPFLRQIKSQKKSNLQTKKLKSKYASKESSSMREAPSDTFSHRARGSWNANKY